MQNIGFIGASGLMGHGIAKNLQRQGPPAGAHGAPQPRPRGRPAGRRCDEAASPAALARALRHRVPLRHRLAAGRGRGGRARTGCWPGAARACVIVDCSTSEPDSTARLRERCAAAGVTFVDAPLARTPVEAEAGKLNVMVGASDRDFARLEPVLKCFAENVFHVGGPGAGHTIKLLNNFIAQAICTATAEAFAVGQRAGVDLKQAGRRWSRSAR